MGKYQSRARGEKALMASLFQPEQDEKRGSAYGVEFGRKRPLDNGGVRDRGAINPLHAVDRMHGRSSVPGYSRTGDADFGVSDGAFGRDHVDGRLTRRSYAPAQSWTSPVIGAGRSGGKPAWASVGRVRNNASDEYAWDPKGDYYYGYPNSRGPF
jgi:hypothetical protein